MNRELMSDGVVLFVENNLRRNIGDNFFALTFTRDELRFNTDDALAWLVVDRINTLKKDLPPLSEEEKKQINHDIEEAKLKDKTWLRMHLGDEDE